MCTSCFTGAIYADDHSNVSFGGEAIFFNNMATDGGTSLKSARFYCISGNAKHISRERRFRWSVEQQQLKQL